MGDEKGKTAQR